MNPSRRRAVKRRTILRMMANRCPTLEQIRKKFRRAKYAPLRACQFCHGKGVLPNDKTLACICLFVSRNLCDFVTDASLNDMGLGKIRKQTKTTKE